MNNLSTSDVICFNWDEFKHIENDEEFIFVSNENFKWFKTSRTGFDILKLLDGNRKISDVIKEIALDYQIEVDLIKDDIINFCEDVVDEELQQKISSNVLKKNNREKLSSVYIEITDFCNLKCSFCNRTCKDVENKFMDFSEFKVLIQHIEDIIDDNGILYITGGEPCLHPQLIKILNYVKEKDINTFLCTNGTLLDENFVVELKEICTGVIVSLDGSNPFFNDKWVGEGTFELRKKSFDLLKKYRIPFMISVTPHDKALECLPEIYRLGYSVGARSVFVNEPNFFRDDGVDLSEYFSSYDSLFEEKDLEVYKENILVNSWQNNQLKQKEENIKTTYFKDCQRCLNNPLKLNIKNTCGAGINEISISLDGNVYPCHNLHLNELNMGKIEEYIELSNEDKNNLISNNVECNNCFYWIFCLGGCRVKAYNNSKDLIKKNPDCERLKSEYFSFLTSPLQARNKDRNI